MTTAATITANLVLESSQYQQGVKRAEAATARLRGKLGQMMDVVRNNALVISALGDGLQNLGKKMTLFISIPIIGFFAMVIKKAMEADTAMGALAQESLERLNTQLINLGDKFLPIVIDALDLLTQVLEKFNSAPTWVQDTVLVLLALVAVAGPIISFIGTILSLISTISTLGPVVAGLGTVFTTLGSAVAAAWTAIVAALAPIWVTVLAIIVIIGALIFIVWAFATDFMGVTTTVKQLIFIIGWAFEKLWKDIKSGSSKAMDWLKSQTKSSVSVWKSNWEQAGQITQKVMQIAFTYITNVLTTFVRNAMMWLAQMWAYAVGVWNGIAAAFYNAWSGIVNFFNSVKDSILAGLQSIIDKVMELINALADIVLPDELTPGSPTPFETGLRGIGKAMQALSRQDVPALNAAMAPRGIAEGGGGRAVHYVDNRRYSAGISAEVMRMSLDDRFEGLLGALQNG